MATTAIAASRGRYDSYTMSYGRLRSRYLTSRNTCNSQLRRLGSRMFYQQRTWPLINTWGYPTCHQAARQRMQKEFQSRLRRHVAATGQPSLFQAYSQLRITRTTRCITRRSASTHCGNAGFADHLGQHRDQWGSRSLINSHLVRPSISSLGSRRHVH